jgi:DNA segregation ATPase FtsK/SpoIIIE-like protein
LQRKLGLGFQKAARIKDMMDDMGFLVPDEKDPKKLRVNLTQEEYEELVRSNEEGEEE